MREKLSHIIKINLEHIPSHIDTTTKKRVPQRTRIYVNNIPMMEVDTHKSRLTFLLQKLGRSTGKSQPGEYWFEYNEETDSV
jgi:hypothetical protein